MEKKFKLSKLNIVTVAIVACTALIVAAAGGSIAYFTDARQTTNVFTAGNVYISLSEAAVKADTAGNLVKDEEKNRIVGNEIGESVVVNNYGKIFPGQTIHKDPTIENTGDDPAWVAAKIIITDGAGDIHKLYGYSGSDRIDLKLLLSGGLLGDTAHVREWNGIPQVSVTDKCAIIQVPNKSEGTYMFYMFMLNELKSEQSVTLFDTMEVQPYFGNTDMRELAELNITVQAFAVQKFGFDSSFEAMSRAFTEHFYDVASSQPAPAE